MIDLSKYEGHTPGPWEAKGPDWYGDYNIAQIGTNPAIGAVVINGRAPDVVMANANLFADAPTILEYARELEARNAELVEALKGARPLVVEAWRNAFRGYEAEAKARLNRLDAALSRAKGDGQ